MSPTLRLVERDAQIGALRELVETSGHSGQTAFVGGEAGHGKTSLLELLVDGLDHRYTKLVAVCEPIGIPAPFAPLFDILDALPDDIADEVRSGAGRHDIYTGILDVLKNDRVLLIIEDVHWADEATLGLIRYVGRRIGATPSTLIVTYRPEDIDLTHPLRLVIADIGPSASRIDLPPLSVRGVAEMTEKSGLDAGAVHAATHGNPFFVEEIARQPDVDLPPNIENAVLALAGTLPSDAHELMYMVALSPEGLGLGLMKSLTPRAVPLLDAMVKRGLLVTRGPTVQCRHDLIRESLARSIPPVMVRDLHGRLLEALEESAESASDTTRLAFHAVGAAEAKKAVEYSLRAARDAKRLEANRQAGYHFRNALEFDGVLTREESLDALLESAKVHSTINQFDTAVDMSARRVEIAERDLEVARARAWYGFFLSRANMLDECRREAAVALSVLADQPVTEELALSLAVLAWADMVNGDMRSAVRNGDWAVAVAREVGSASIEVQAATTAGTAKGLLGDPMGREQVERAMELGTSLGLGEYAARTINNLGLPDLWDGHPLEALATFDRLAEYTQAHELDAWYIAALTTRAGLRVTTGSWNDADQDLEMVGGQRTCRQTEVEILLNSSTLRMRRGDPGASERVDEAVESVRGFTDYEATVSICALMMEAAWIGIKPLQPAADQYALLRRAQTFNSDRSGRETLGYWALRLGLPLPDTAIPGPVDLERVGHHSEAAAEWEKRGYPIEAAVAAGVAPGADLEAIVATLNKRGAHGVVRGLQKELRRRGATWIPRGERSQTRQHPAGLTPRQSEVLALIAAGMSNAAIAEELFISEKTASHHVSAILGKLKVSSRLQAAAVATANGWASWERLPT